MPELRYAELMMSRFMASPVSLDHGTIHQDLNGWLSFTEATRPAASGSDTTWVMGPKDTPQPDIFLRILPDFGGQSKDVGKYCRRRSRVGVEVSGSSLSRDLGIKLELYRTAGVREYLTVQLNPRAIVWRQLSRGRYREIPVDADGILRSRVFPGLWLDPEALWNGTLLQVAERASPRRNMLLRKASVCGKRSK